MENTVSPNILLTLGLGTIAGMRAMCAPALLSHFLAKTPVAHLKNSPLHYLQEPKVAIGLKLLAAAELVGDKMPNTPNRTIAPQLLVRVSSGALAGATLYQIYGEQKLIGALLGGLAAAASTYAFYYLRKELGSATGLPDAAVAVLEDALVVAGGVALLKD